MAVIVGLNHLSRTLNDHLNQQQLSTDELFTLLDGIDSLLTGMDQDESLPMKFALIPLKNALVTAELLTHPNSDVRVSVLSCFSEIMRITAPDSPFSDDLMKGIFRLLIESFEKLASFTSRGYRKAVSVLQNVARVRSFLLILDMECNDLILLMFRNFLITIRSDHPPLVLSSMETIMTIIIDEMDQVSTDLINVLLTTVKKDNQSIALKSTGTTLDMYFPVVSSICKNVTNTSTKDEMEKAHKELMQELTGISDDQTFPKSIGIKRLGKADSKPFWNVCKQRFNNVDEARLQFAKLYSKWKKNLDDLSWAPFHIVKDEDGTAKEVVDEEDDKLRSLRDEWGEEVKDAVKTALEEINEFGRNVPTFLGFQRGENSHS